MGIIHINAFNSNLVRSFFVTLTGSGLSKILMVLATLVCSNMLSQSDFGEFSFLKNTLTLIVSMCGLNFSNLCTKFATETKTLEYAKTRLLLVCVFSIVLCVLIGLGILILPGHVLLSLFRTDSMVHLFRIVGFFLPLFILQPLFEGILRGYLQFKLISAIQILTSAYLLVITFISIKLYGLQGAFIGILSYYGLYSIILAACMLKRQQIRGIIDRCKGLHREIHILYVMILPVFITSFMEVPVSWLSQLMIVQYGNYEEIASLSVIMQMRNMIYIIPAYFFSTFMGFVGKLNAEGNVKDYYAKFDLIGRKMMWYSIVMVVAISVCGKFILGLYGSQYKSEYTPFVIAMASIIFSMRTGLYKISLVIREYQKFLMVVSFCWSMVWLAGMYLTMKLSLLTPLYSFFISYFLGVVIEFLCVRYVFVMDRRKQLFKEAGL